MGEIRERGLCDGREGVYVMGERGLCDGRERVM
jgi:hypothetical protein